jgi:hypothetical protein
MARLKSELELTCPCCNAVLVIDTNLGRVIEHRDPPNPNRPELSDAQRILAGPKRGGTPSSNSPSRTTRRAATRCRSASRRR